MKKIPFPHFRGEQIEAQKGDRVTCPGHRADKLSEISKPGRLSQNLLMQTLDYTVIYSASVYVPPIYMPGICYEICFPIWILIFLST